MPSVGLRRSVLLGLCVPALVACSERVRSARLGGRPWLREMPDERPQLLNTDVPFRYPVSLYLNKIQGNVLLRLFVDAAGHVVPESTQVREPSGYAAFDSAALAGVSQLRFRAAHLRGTAVPVVLLFPVHFRHPGERTVPQDSL